MSETLGEYKIECGRFRGRVRARSLGAAWRKLTKDRKTGFARLARFQVPNIPVWQYCEPEYLDSCP
jgi:hypothetical protein